MRANRRAEQSLNIFELIDSICDGFRQQWRDGNEPKIEEFVDQVSRDARENLFRNLIQIDQRYRDRAGLPASSSEYVRRFPDYERIIRREFDDLLASQSTASVDTPNAHTDALDETIELTAASRIGDYKLVRELGKGGFGTVYEATHLARGNRVALKTLPTGIVGQEKIADRLHRFRNEFRRLAEINHPNLVGMQTLEVDGGQWFFTMDLIEGTDFLQYVRPNDALDESRLRSALTQLVEGIAALHDERIIHRDVKPSNVMVNRDGRVIVLDFGLIAEIELATDKTQSMHTEHFAGTPSYAAPEQIFGDRFPASDWYAVGTMVFEALTGERPFQESGPQVLIVKRERDAPALGERSDLPSDLTDLVDALLRRVPDERPEVADIANALELDLDTISRSASESIDDESIKNTSHERELTLIGREEQIRQLANAHSSFVEHKHSQVVWVSGRSGDGKSSLVDYSLRQLAQEGEYCVLRGRCYDRESVPFKAVDAIIGSLAGFLRSAGESNTTRWLPDDVVLLARVFPELRRVDVIDQMTTTLTIDVSSDKLRYRAFQAFRELLYSIARDLPVVVFIDDLQWGDADSAQVLHELANSHLNTPIEIICSYRSDEEANSQFLQRWKELNNNLEATASLEITVDSLTEEQCIEFATHRLNIDPADITKHASKLVADTGGNPYLLEQLIDSFDRDLGQFQSYPVQSIISQRLARLPLNAESLLVSIAASGQAIDMEEAAQAAGLQESAIALLTHMRSERLVRLIGDSERPFVDTYHDKIRESILTSLGPQKRMQAHLRLAESIENVAGLNGETILDDYSSIAGDTPDDSHARNKRVFDLAYHFEAADDPRALGYQLAAGEEANRSFAIQESLDHFKQATSRLTSEASATTQFRVWQGQGVALTRARKADLARESLEKALACAPTALDRARSYVGLSLLSQLLGHFAEALNRSNQALAEIGRKAPTTSLQVLLKLPHQLGRVFLIPDRWQVLRRDKDQAIAKIEYADADSRTLYVFDRDTLLSVEAQCRQLIAAKRVGDPAVLSYAYSCFSGLPAILGLGSFVRWCERRAKKYGALVDDQQAKVQLSYVRFNSAVADLDWNNALTHNQDSLDGYFRLGMHSNANMSAHMSRHLKEWSGCTSEELHWAKRELTLGLESGDERAQCWGHYGVAAAHARAGRLADACSEMAKSIRLLAEETRNMTESICRLSHAYVMLQCSEYEHARMAALRSWNLAIKKRMENIFTVRSFAHTLEGLIGPRWLESEGIQETSEIRRILRSSLRTRILVSAQKCIVERASARALWLTGKKGKALRFLERSVASGRRTGFKTDTARALLDLAAIKKDDRSKNRAEAVQLLLETESVIPHAESWLLGDQYDKRVVAPEFDLHTWEADNGLIEPKSSAAPE